MPRGSEEGAVPPGIKNRESLQGGGGTPKDPEDR